jgi:amino acid transporter
MIFFGAISSVIAWVSGPSKGVLEAGKTGLLPPLLQKTNEHGVQSGILIFQGIIVTVLAFIYVLVPNVSDVFIALVGMAAALYVIMYIMMFAAAIYLRKKEPNVVRGYKVPALTFIAGVGLVACVIALIMSFFPTVSESAIPHSIYPLVVAIVVVVLGVPPLIFYAVKKASWDQRSDQDKSKSYTH